MSKAWLPAARKLGLLVHVEEGVYYAATPGWVKKYHQEGGLWKFGD